MPDEGAAVVEVDMKALARIPWEMWRDLGWNGETLEDLQRVVAAYRKYQETTVSVQHYAAMLARNVGRNPPEKIWDTINLVDYLQIVTEEAKRQAARRAAFSVEQQMNREYSLTLAGLRTMIDMLVDYAEWSHAAKNTVLRGARLIIDKQLEKWGKQREVNPPIDMSDIPF